MNSDYNTLLCVLFDVDPLLIQDVIDFRPSHPVYLDNYLGHVGFPISDLADLKVTYPRIFCQKVLK